MTSENKTDTSFKKRVVVLGASNKPERYSNKAIHMLREKGFEVIPIHPKLTEIEGIPVVAKLSDIKEPFHTLTLYVGPQRTEPMVDALVQSKPQRIIMNPGTESDLLKSKFEEAGIEVVAGCTLVMLQTGYF